MSTPEGYNTPQAKLLLELDQGFEKKDIDLIAKPLHKDFVHKTHPRSLGSPDLTREQWLQHLQGIISLWTDRESIVHSITEAPGKVILHGTNKTKTKIGIDMVRESIFVAHIAPDEEGNLKIKLLEEFTDSKAHLDQLSAVKAAGLGAQ